MLAKIMMALGLSATMSAATATPSLAQGVYFEGPGFGVGVGRPAYRDRDYRYREYNYVPRDRYRHGCRTVTIERDDYRNQLAHIKKNGRDDAGGNADVGEADVPDLALALQFGERAHRLVKRHLRIGRMQLID